jgi:hypothetical protein
MKLLHTHFSCPLHVCSVPCTSPCTLCFMPTACCSVHEALPTCPLHIYADMYFSTPFKKAACAVPWLCFTFGTTGHHHKCYTMCTRSHIISASNMIFTQTSTSITSTSVVTLNQPPNHPATQEHTCTHTHAHARTHTHARTHAHTHPPVDLLQHQWVVADALNEKVLVAAVELLYLQHNIPASLPCGKDC